MFRIPESYFEQLKHVGKDRLSPSGEVFYLIGLFFYSCVFIAVNVFAIDELSLSDEVMMMHKLLIGLTVILFVYLVPLLIFEKLTFTFQKLTAVLTVVYTLILAVAPFLTCYLKTLNDLVYGVQPGMSRGYMYWQIFCMTVAILTFVLFFMITQLSIKQGGLSENGKGMFMGSIYMKYLFGVIGVLYIIGVIWLLYILGFSSNFLGHGVFFFLLICFTAAVQEFIVLAYCRIKFPSFQVSYEEATKYRVKKKKKKEGRKRA